MGMIRCLRRQEREERDVILFCKREEASAHHSISCMGTELQYNLNLFATLPKNKHDVVTAGFNTQDTGTSFKNRLLKVGIWTGFDQLQESMDRLLEQFNKDSVKDTMLKHEEIFKQQVSELHRLYRIQKMLMAELRTNATPTMTMDTRTRFWGSTSTSETSHSSHAGKIHNSTAQLNSFSSLQRYNRRAGPSSQELSIFHEEPLRVQRGINLEQPAEEETVSEVKAIEDQTPIFRKHLKEKMSMEDSDFWTGESEIELTLSIGCGADKKKLKHWLHPDIELVCSKSTPSETRQVIFSSPDRQDRGEECSDASAICDRESLQQPPWLFQGLSLNRT